MSQYERAKSNWNFRASLFRHFAAPVQLRHDKTTYLQHYSPPPLEAPLPPGYSKEISTQLLPYSPLTDS